MNCHTAKTWLMTAKSSEPLPNRLKRHLSSCPDCRFLQEQLDQIEHLTGRLETLVPSVHPKARRRLDALLDEAARETRALPTSETLLLPLETCQTPSLPPRSSRFEFRRWAASAVALLILGVGCLLGRYSSPPARLPAVTEAPRAEPKASPPRSVAVEPAVPILVRVASLAPRVAGDKDPSARLEALVLLADELRSECLQLAKRGQFDDLARMANLHDRVLREGVVAQAARLSPGTERDAAVARLVEKLHRVEAEVADRERRAPASIAAEIRPLGRSAREVARLLAEGASGADVAPPAAEAGRARPLDGLVSLVVRLSREDAPLPRAEASVEVAELLTRATVHLSVAGQTQFATRMGNYLDGVVTHGIAGNLDVAEATELPQVQEEVAQIRERARVVGTDFESDFARETPDVQEGLQPVLEVFRNDRERTAKGNKAKGKSEQKGKGNGRGKDNDKKGKGKSNAREKKDGGGKPKAPPSVRLDIMPREVANGALALARRAGFVEGAKNGGAAIERDDDLAVVVVRKENFNGWPVMEDFIEDLFRFRRWVIGGQIDDDCDQDNAQALAKILFHDLRAGLGRLGGDPCNGQNQNNPAKGNRGNDADDKAKNGGGRKDMVEDLLEKLVRELRGKVANGMDERARQDKVKDLIENLVRELRARRANAQPGGGGKKDKAEDVADKLIRDLRAKLANAKGGAAGGGGIKEKAQDAAEKLIRNVCGQAANAKNNQGKGLAGNGGAGQGNPNGKLGVAQGGRGVPGGVGHGNGLPGGHGGMGHGGLVGNIGFGHGHQGGVHGPGGLGHVAGQMGGHLMGHAMPHMNQPHFGKR